MVFIKFPCQVGMVYLSEFCVKGNNLRNRITEILGTTDFKLFRNDKELVDSSDLKNDSIVHIAFTLPGGKGGFGSMLRAIGAQIEKTTNREACRDLSGRRLRDINEEQRLKNWLSKESERAADKEKRRAARIERLKHKPKHNFVDVEYEKKISELPERVDDAVAAGLSKISKRPAEEAGGSSQGPKKKWLYDDMSDSSENDSAEECSPKKSTADIAGPSTSDSSCSMEVNQSFRPAETIPCPDDESSMDSAESSKDNVETAKDKAGTSMDIAGTPSFNPDCVASESSSSQENASLTSNSNSEVIVSTDSGTSATVPSQHSLDTKPRSEEVVSKAATSEDHSPFDLSLFGSCSELESLGPDRLKTALTVRGLKCGGSLTERAERLWKVRGLEPNQYPSYLMAKKRKR